MRNSSKVGLNKEASITSRPKCKIRRVLHHPITMCGGIQAMNIREGLIPTALGSAVTATGYALKQKRGANKMVANTVFGFGLAHVVLGVIDLVQHRR